MSPHLTSLLLLCAVVIGYWEITRHGRTTVIRCSRCGDLVQTTPGLPVCCPSCRRWLIA